MNEIDYIKVLQAQYEHTHSVCPTYVCLFRDREIKEKTQQLKTDQIRIRETERENNQENRRRKKKDRRPIR